MCCYCFHCKQCKKFRISSILSQPLKILMNLMSSYFWPCHMMLAWDPTANALFGFTALFMGFLLSC